MNLLNQLLSLASQKKLGHFYILTPTKNSPEAQALCEKFCADFLTGFFKQSGVRVPSEAWNHPDVFRLGNLSTEEGSGQNFNVEEALGLIRFFEFSTVEANHKFAIITEAARINTIVANKWLKLLEEPLKNSTIILINAGQLKLLETIESRGILLRLDIPKVQENHDDFEKFIKDSRQMGLSQFLETYQKDTLGINYWVEKLVLWETDQTDGHEAKAALGIWLLKLKEMETFHQPSATKWTLFWDLLKTHVFPRAITLT